MALTDNVYAIWHLNSDYLDSSGNGNNLTNVGSIFDTVNKKLGSACASLDGTNDYLNAGTSLSDVLKSKSTAWSVSLWLKTADTTGFIMDSRENPNPSDEVRCSTGGVFTYDNDGVGETGVTASTSLTDDDWHHLVYTCSASVIEIWVDGFSEDTGDVSGVNDLTLNDIAVFGARRLNGGNYSSGHANYLAALLDEINVWTRVITDAEIGTDLWNGGAGLELTMPTGGLGGLVGKGLTDAGLMGGMLT